MTFLAHLALSTLLGLTPVRPGPADTVTITGTVTHADGSPAATCQVLVLHPGFEPMARTACDSAGQYRLRIPAGEYNAIAIPDDGYGESRLEFWAWNVAAWEDMELSAVLDRLELYDLAVWASKGATKSFFLSFRPMSIERYDPDAAPEPRVVAGEEVPVVDIAPALDAEHVDVWVDGRPTEIELFQWYYQRFPDPEGPDSYQPVALVQVARPDLEAGPHGVRVRIRDRETGALGEAVTFFSSNAAGLGF